MTNDHYQFKNIVRDLRACRSLLVENGIGGVLMHVSDDEQPHVVGLIKLCREMAEAIDNGDFDLEEEN